MVGSDISSSKTILRSVSFSSSHVGFTHTSHCWLRSPQQWPLSGGPTFLLASSPRSFHKVFYVTLIKHSLCLFSATCIKSRTFLRFQQCLHSDSDLIFTSCSFTFLRNFPPLAVSDPGLFELAVSFQFCHCSSCFHVVALKCNSRP